MHPVPADPRQPGFLVLDGGIPAGGPQREGADHVLGKAAPQVVREGHLVNVNVAVSVSRDPVHALQPFLDGVLDFRCVRGAHGNVRTGPGADALDLCLQVRGRLVHRGDLAADCRGAFRAAHLDLLSGPGDRCLDRLLHGHRPGRVVDRDVRAGPAGSVLDGILQGGVVRAAHLDLRAVHDDVALQVRALAVHADGGYFGFVGFQCQRGAYCCGVSCFIAVCQRVVDRHGDHFSILHGFLKNLVQVRVDFAHVSALLLNFAQHVVYRQRSPENRPNHVALDHHRVISRPQLIDATRF